jgi:hypothetical protein
LAEGTVEDLADAKVEYATDKKEKPNQISMFEM